MTSIERALDSATYWYDMWLMENKLSVKFQEETKELQEWIEEVAISNCRAYDFGYSEGYRKGLVDADTHSYAAGYSDGCSGSDYDDGTI